ncbi:uncharacterized protein LOC131623036 [Vicia villosa]|uniref:uncharacterized protein LOC131623036 n=1 Tax=Vicia villosa TaxID=3911 RepID=UPI00273C3472|nr:uncharacterized protein LOC131623036 [Vicia villosa]
MKADDNEVSDGNTKSVLKEVKVEEDEIGQSSKTQPASLLNELGQTSGANHDALLKDVKVERDAGQPSQVNNNDKVLQKEISWEKEITKSQIRGHQVMQFPQEVIKKALRPDITGCRLYDLEDLSFYECKILKSNRKYVEMYLGYGWYAFVQDRKLKVGDKVVFNYNSDQEILYARVERKVKQTSN